MDGNYVGGIYGYVYRGQLSYFSVDNTDINGNSLVGGIAGSSDTGQMNGYRRSYMKVGFSNVTSVNGSTGGIMGYMSTGENSYWSVNDCNINVTSINSNYVGGMFGRSDWGNVAYGEVVNTEINSAGSNVGGFIGGNSYSATSSSVNYCYIINSTVHGASNVGGVIGQSQYGSMTRVYVNASIKADKGNAGGFIGYLNTPNATSSGYFVSVYNTMILNTSVTAPTKVGGFIGDIAVNIFRDQSFYYNNYIDADVTSTNTSTGSLIIGGRPDENDYIDNTYVYKYSKLNGNYVYATNDNVDNGQYLVRADLNNQSTYSSNIGLGTTYWNYAPLAQGKYPKIKDNYLYQPELQTGIDLPVDPEIAEINMLKTSDEYEDDDNNGSKNDVSDVNPNSQNSLISQNSIDAENAIALPNYKVYPISSNEINVDFNDVVSDYNAINFTYYVNGQEQETVELSNSTNQTYTFKYNFMDTIEIKLTRKNNLDLNNSIEESNQAEVASDEKVNSNTETITNLGSDEDISSNTETITITPENIRSETSLTGENNAYLLGTNLYVNGELQQGEYVNLYGGKALNSSGQIVDIATKQVMQSENTDAKGNTREASNKITENSINDSAETSEGVNTITQDYTYLEETTKPIHTYEYKGNTIEVYGTYSKINGNIKTQIYNVRSGKLSALSNSLDMKIGNNITDNYNNKEYQTILSTEGNLVDLKEQLQYPDNFLARNIKQIVQNTDEEKTEIMVLYNTGKAIVFNYVTGDIVYENNEKADNGLADYLAGSIENIWNDYEEKQKEYAKSKELEQKLAELPVEKAIEQVNGVGQNNNSQSENENADNDYITVYNAETGKYEVYSEDEILNSNEEAPVSETEKITQNGLEGVYGYNAKEETKPQANGAIIVIAIIAVAVIALVILRKIIGKNNTKKKK